MNSKSYKVVGQEKPLADIVSGLYTVPAQAQFVASTLTVCNQSDTEIDSFTIQIVKAGQTPDDAGFIFFKKPIDPNDTKSITIGIALSEGDAVLVKSVKGNLSFNLFGAVIA